MAAPMACDCSGSLESRKKTHHTVQHREPDPRGLGSRFSLVLRKSRDAYRKHVMKLRTGQCLNTCRRFIPRNGNVKGRDIPRGRPRVFLACGTVHAVLPAAVWRVEDESLLQCVMDRGDRLWERALYPNIDMNQDAVSRNVRFFLIMSPLPGRIAGTIQKGTV